MTNKLLRVFIVGLFLTILLFIDIRLNYEDLSSPSLCNGALCTNKDPGNMLCERDAKTLVTKIVEDIQIELRYSKKCNAGWSRASVPPRSILYLQDANGTEYGRYSVTADTKAGDHFGDMGSGRQLRACVELPEGKHICTEMLNQ
jgi:Protein of unknown function (DUF2690)